VVQERLQRLRTRLPDLEADALLVSQPENRRYLSGFTGSAGYLLITPREAVLATDFRYVEQAGQQAPLYRVVRIGADPSWLADLARDLGLRRIAFEAHHLTVAQHRAFAEALKRAFPQDGPALVGTMGVVERLRAVKEPGERARIERACEIADRALLEVAEALRPGMTEREVAWRLERRMRELGAEAVAFEVIVASGPHSALPHHRPTDRPLREGEPIVIDLGARYEGYCSDMTRTFCLGEPDETFRTIYDTVLSAQLVALATLRPGMTAGEADALAREVIQRAGYGERFGHALGHGIGLAVHEHPRLGPGSQDPLEPGMVFTVEPGIYLPGWGGVRIEDTVLLEGEGVRPLNRVPKHEHPSAGGGG